MSFKTQFLHAFDETIGTKPESARYNRHYFHNSIYPSKTLSSLSTWGTLACDTIRVFRSNAIICISNDFPSGYIINKAVSSANFCMTDKLLTI